MIDYEILKNHVDEMVAKHGAAIIPDAIEKNIYGKFITLLFKALDKISGQTMFRIFGHEIAFFIKPANVAIQFSAASANSYATPTTEHTSSKKRTASESM